MLFRSVPFDQACATVLLPKLSVDRNKMRKELLDEINKRPKAAARTPAAAAAATTTRENTGPRDTEDIIREAIASLGS